MATDAQRPARGDTDQEPESLRAQVVKLVEKHASCRDIEPHLAVGETIVMAVILQGLKSFTSEEALKAVFSHFPYWNATVIERYFDQEGSFDFVNDWDDAGKCLVPGFFQAFLTYAMPLRILPQDYTPCTKYELSDSAARYSLRHRLETTRRGTFPFMKLPAELRNVIYEMVVRFPNPGLSVRRPAERLHLESIRGMDDDDLDLDPGEEVDRFESSDDWSDSPRFGVAVSKLDLSILKVCKQIYAEAMPIFYGLNTFTMQSAESFYYGFIKRRPQLEIQCLRRVSLIVGGGSYVGDWADFKHWTLMCQSLASMKLELLVIALQDSHFLKMSARARREYFSRSTQFTKIQRIPGFGDLAIAAAAAKEFVLYEAEYCPAIKKYLDDAIASLKAGAAAIETEPKKRAKKQFKSAEKVVEDEEPGKKAKKRKRVKAT